HGQLGFGAFGRAMEEIHAEESEECGEIGDGHGRSSAAADVLIAGPRPLPAGCAIGDVCNARIDARGRGGRMPFVARGLPRDHDMTRLWSSKAQVEFKRALR